MTSDPVPASLVTPPADVSFAGALARAATVAQRSPSSHNCQPWGLATLVSAAGMAEAARLTGGRGDQHYVAVAVDGGRVLTALGGAHHIEMLLSCGMYRQLLGDSLAVLGWRLRHETVVTGIDRFGPSWPAAWSPLWIASAESGPVDAAAFDQVARLADQRRTNRSPYLPGPIDFDALATVAGHDVELRRVRTSDERRRVAQVVARYGGRDYGDPAAWRETHSYLRGDQADADRRGDGFTYDQLFGPLTAARRALVRTALHPASMRLLRPAGYHRVLAHQVAAGVRRSTDLIVVSRPGDRHDAAEVAACGRAIMRVWLEATRQGLALHPLSVVLQHDDARRTLQTELGIGGRAYFLARIGPPTVVTRPTARRPYAECIRQV